MATGQTILNLLEDVHPELQLQATEADVSKGLRLLNAAQDFFEIIAAGYPDFLGSAVGTVTQTASQEWTTFPSGVLRIDRLQFIDPNTSRPAWDLANYKQTGSHAWNQYWQANLVSSTTTGRPRAYWTNGTRIYWDPLPDTTNTVRWYGFQGASDITAVGTFAYSDAVMLPLAAFAGRINKTGLDDSTSSLVSLAKDLFDPLISAMGNFNRDRAAGFEYRRFHTT